MQLATTTALFTNFLMLMALSLSLTLGLSSALAATLVSGDLKAKLAARIKRTYLTFKIAFNQHIIPVYGGG